MHPNEGDTREFFRLGQSLAEVSQSFFRDQRDGREKVLSILGFRDESDYETAQEGTHEERFPRKNRASLFEEKVANWEDLEKRERILELFNSLSNLGQIRSEVFPEWFEGRKSREAYRFYRALANHIILRVLDCETWDDYHRKRRNLRARRRYRKRKEEGTLVDKAVLKAAMERDGHRCVITGSDKRLNVHHIDGDRNNNALDNLVTLSKGVHQAIHNGARACHEDSLMYWERRTPQYVAKLNKRMDYLSRYAEYLRSSGYSEARIECVSGEVLFLHGLSKKLNISPVKKRIDGWYNVVVFEPTGHRGEPEANALRNGHSDWTDEMEQKCEDCPYEGEPPCGDYHPGPYCLSSPRVRDEPSCDNCTLRETERCPFFDTEQGDDEKRQICDRWIG